MERLNKDAIGTNTLLLGESGSGKTASIASFIKAGLEVGIKTQVACIITEPGGYETLLDGLTLHEFDGKPLPADRLHYTYIPPTSTSWKTLTALAQRVNTLSYKALSDMKSGIEKQGNTQFLDLLTSLSNFVNQDGEEFGPVDDFDNTWLLVIDSLSGVNMMARSLHVGMKPSMHQGEWGVIMETEEALINQVISATKCFTCFTAHVEKEMDETIGKPQFFPMLLGRKLAPKVPRMFSDVILAYKESGKFRWSTARDNYSSLKNRNLPLSDSLNPSFEGIFETWLERNSKNKGNG